MKIIQKYYLQKSIIEPSFFSIIEKTRFEILFFNVFSESLVWIAKYSLMVQIIKQRVAKINIQ